MVWSSGYEELRGYLRGFSNVGGDPAYDTHGVLMLLLALVDNLRERGEARSDLPELAGSITREQAAFLEQLARWAVEPHRDCGFDPDEGHQRPG